MKDDWLTASSFERMHEIISAINTIIINAKLTISGIDDPAEEAEVEDARKHLFRFLERLQALLNEAEQSPDGTVLGADPRLGNLATRYLSQKRRLPKRSDLYSITLTELSDLLKSDRPEVLSALISYLQELRWLIENNFRADVVGVLGEI